jgi:hypothetical protein
MLRFVAVAILSTLGLAIIGCVFGAMSLAFFVS